MIMREQVGDLQVKAFSSENCFYIASLCCVWHVANIDPRALHLCMRTFTNRSQIIVGVFCASRW
jgi:hypothetical protein